MSKSKNVLEILFESGLRIKMLKYVFRNAPSSFSLRELANHVQDKPAAVKKELDKLISIGLIKVKN